MATSRDTTSPIFSLMPVNLGRHKNGYMISSTASISRLPTDYPATTMPARCHPGWSSAWSASIRSVRACPTTWSAARHSKRALSRSKPQEHRTRISTSSRLPLTVSRTTRAISSIQTLWTEANSRSSWEIAPIKNGLLPPDRFHLQWGYKERRIKKSFTYSCSASPSYQTQGRNFQYREESGKNRKGNLRGINIAFLLNFIIFTR